MHTKVERPREAVVGGWPSLLYRAPGNNDTSRTRTHTRTHLRRRHQIAHHPHGNRHHRRTNHSAPAQHMLPCYLEECIYICFTPQKKITPRIHFPAPTRYLSPRAVGAHHSICLAREAIPRGMLALHAVLCAET